MRFNIGRLNRVGFSVAILVDFIFMILVILNTPSGFGMTLVFVNFPLLIFLYSGRLHDIGYSGMYSILVMLTSIAGIIVLTMWAGQKDTNKYGKVPPSSISHLLYFWRMNKII